MRPSTLIKHNLSHYWRTNLAVILGVAIAVAVLAGALLVGDSVRASLHGLALSRLGKTDFVLTSTGFFRQQLADDLQAQPQFASSFIALAPIIALAGVITRDENRARAGGVQVYGIDDRFWKFHGANVEPLTGGDVYLSQSLAHELGTRAGDAIVLRIEKPSAIPVESLHGRKDESGRSIRLTMRQPLPRSSLGEFSLRPQQGAVRALFVSLRKLQRDLGQENRINTILLSAKIADGASAQTAARVLKEKFTLSDLGLKLRILPDQKLILLESDSSVISDRIAEQVKSIAERLNHRVVSILTYLANTIRIGEKSVPYSLVTALDDIGQTELEKSDNGPPPMIINDWAARDLAAHAG